MSYMVNAEKPEIRMDVVRTFRYQAEEEGDKRDGTPCVELKSEDGRYGLICSADDFATLPLSKD
jgi:hypothetical protein